MTEYARFSVLTSHDTALWMQQFMDKNQCSGTEALRWLVGLAKEIDEIEAEPGVRLAAVRRRNWGRWDVHLMGTNRPDQKIVPASVDEAPTKLHPSGLRVIDGGGA